MAAQVGHIMTGSDDTESSLDEDSARGPPLQVDNSVMVGRTSTAGMGRMNSMVRQAMNEVDQSMFVGRASTTRSQMPQGLDETRKNPALDESRPAQVPRGGGLRDAEKFSMDQTCSSAQTALERTVQQCDGPVQFIEINDEGKCHVKREAMEILKMCKGSISVVAVAGLYRTGKSFLLNRLLGLQDGFDIGRSINPCTKGLWIWGRPVELAPDYHCILMDTEGLGSAQRSASHDLQILSLTVLLSSVFIYNSIGAIDEQAIDELHLVLQLASHVFVSTKREPGKGSKRDATDQLAPYLPSFFWVLRDFHLHLEDKQGKTVTEKGYLESALEPPPQSRPNDEKNRIRKVIRDLFSQRDCATLPRPVTDEEDLRRVKDLPYESLRPEFREKVEAFCGTVFRSLRQKTMDGENVSGPMFVELAQQYCKAMNSGAIPTIESAWNSVVKHQMRLSLKDAIQAYRKEMSEKALAMLPMDEYTLYNVHKTARENASEVLHESHIDTRNPVVAEYRRELVAKCDEIYEQIASENKVAIQQQCVCAIC